MSFTLPFRRIAPSPVTYTTCTHRLFSSTPRECKISFYHIPASIAAEIPPYPYGPSPIYKQSNHGLYSMQKIRFGNKVSEKNAHKNRKIWRPSVQKKLMWSNALGRSIRVKITSRTLRTVDKAGGLDRYLTGDKAQRIKELGQFGWMLRWRVMKSEWWEEKRREERKIMGLDELEGKAEDETRLEIRPEELKVVQSIDEIIEKSEGGVVGEGAESDVEEVEGKESDVEEAEERSFMHEEPKPKKSKLPV